MGVDKSEREFAKTTATKSNINTTKTELIRVVVVVVEFCVYIHVFLVVYRS